MQQQPYHTDKHGMAFNLTLILALGMLGLGLFQGDPMFITIGVVFGGFSWLTTPKSYVVLDDRLIIVYGQPRTRVIPFDTVENMELLRLPIGERVAVWTHGKKRYILQPRNAAEFHQKLREALGYPEDTSAGVVTESEDPQVVLFGDKINPEDRKKVLDLLVRWTQVTSRIEMAFNALRTAPKTASASIQSENFEQCRIAAIEVAEEAHKEVADGHFWPALEGSTAAEMMSGLREKSEESCKDYILFLGLAGDVSGALNDDSENIDLPLDSVLSARQSLERNLNELSSRSGQLARYYCIAVQECQG